MGRALHLHRHSPCRIDAAEEKRNIGSVKNSQRLKRDASYDDFPDDSDIIDPDLYQNYNDIIYPANELYPNYGLSDISYEKRYLGKLFQHQYPIRLRFVTPFTNLPIISYNI